MAQGTQLGVNSTPSFFVNGRFLSGAQPFAAFQALIDEVLASK
jgi:protein-disulfide isomerase